MQSQVSRRQFGQLVGLGAVHSALPARASDSPNEKLNIGMVGVGTGSVGGIMNLPAMSSQNIVAMCDVDHKYAGPNFAKYPKATIYSDFRKMLDKQKEIDAVVISTPDHLHASIAIAAMRQQKHVYVEKPMAQTIYEARLMAKVAAETNVVTQMGNQGTGDDNYRTAVEIVRSGDLGEIREVFAWTNRPTWPQGTISIPREGMPVPSSLQWDLFLGPAAKRDYHKAYHPFVWRGWWDFGTCVLGDMACHITNLAYMGLDLGYPEKIDAKSENNSAHTGPTSAMIRYHFPSRGVLPPVTMTWLEGKWRPDEKLFLGSEIPTNGLLIVGKKGRLLTGNMYCTKFTLLPTEKFRDYQAPEPYLPRVGGHHHEWIQACKTGSRTTSNFQYAGRFVESLLAGNVALRLDKSLEWDGLHMKARNCPEADAYINPARRKGWEL